MNDGIRMQISAYVDGELPENEAELLLRRMSQDAELRQEVAEYLGSHRLGSCHQETQRRQIQPLVGLRRELSRT